MLAAARAASWVAWWAAFTGPVYCPARLVMLLLTPAQVPISHKPESAPWHLDGRENGCWAQGVSGRAAAPAGNSTAMLRCLLSIATWLRLQRADISRSTAPEEAAADPHALQVQPCCCAHCSSCGAVRGSPELVAGGGRKLPGCLTPRVCAARGLWQQHSFAQHGSGPCHHGELTQLHLEQSNQLSISWWC